jgi:hypothetical protein
VRLEEVEDRAAQPLHGARLGGEHVLDVLGKEPARGSCDEVEDREAEHHRREPGEADLAVVIVVSWRNVSRQMRGAVKGRMPSITSMRASAASQTSLIARRTWCPGPDS